MKKQTKKVLKTSAVALGTAAVALGGAFGIADLFVSIALDRRPPKILDAVDRHIGGSKKKDDALTKSIQEAALCLQAHENEIVRITAHDGTPLVGHFIPAPQPRRVIIAFHGWRSKWYKNFGLQSKFWYEDGCSVLYVEQRGQNESGGAYMGFGMTERYDCLDWINFIIGKCGAELPIYLAGVSMGAATVLMASGLALPENVHGILADCGYTSPRAIFRHVAQKNLHIGYGVKGKIADEIYKHKLRMDPGACSAVQELRRATVPVLFIHGTADRFVPIEMTFENYLACASPKELLVVPGAGHTYCCAVDPERYRKTEEEFFAKWDGAHPTPH